MKGSALLLALLLMLLLWLMVGCTTLAAQEPVRPVPDVASWATAFAMPSIAAWHAARSADPKCKFAQLAISEAIGNVAVLSLKHWVVSPRPCLGCAADGFPSGHSMNSVIGLSSGWRVGLFLAIGTGELRDVAQRHTKTQIAAGLALGGLAEWAGQRLVRCRS